MNRIPYKHIYENLILYTCTLFTWGKCVSIHSIWKSVVKLAFQKRRITIIQLFTINLFLCSLLTVKLFKCWLFILWLTCNRWFYISKVLSLQIIHYKVTANYGDRNRWLWSCRNRYHSEGWRRWKSWQAPRRCSYRLSHAANPK